MRLMTELRSVACALAMLCAGTGTAHAQEFAGRVVDVMVNFSPGGPTDLEARVFAEHLPRFLKGTRAVVVRNVAGAGGLIGVNQLGDVSEKNKLNIGFFTWDPMNQILKNPNLRVQFNDLKFIAGMQQTNLLYIRRDAAPGIAKPADIAKVDTFNAAVLSNGSDWSALRQGLALDLLGAKYRTITGYKGTREAEMAMVQGDIQLVSNSLPGYNSFAKPTLVDKGLAIPLFQYERGDGNLKRSPDLPDVPTFLEVYRDIHGANANPGGDKWEALQFLNRIVARMPRVIFMPPNAPDAAVAELRSAVERMAKDPQFIAQYEKAALTPAHFVLGADGERVIAELKSMPPAMVIFFNQYIQSNSAR
jgi:tripartite-type tricarboxylate transporter receptor subunit TctC